MGRKEKEGRSMGGRGNIEGKDAKAAKRVLKTLGGIVDGVIIYGKHERAV